MTVVVMSLAVLGMIILYKDYREREVVLCQVMGVWGMGQLGNSGCDGIVIMYWDYLGRVMRMCQASCLRVIIMGQLEEYLMRY
jgi:hypothetical protein